MSAGWIASPAKLNLFLAVTGRRPDGYHDLVSVAATVEWGDRLRVRLVEGETREDTLVCDDPAIPRDERNLVLKAAALFREAAERKGAVDLNAILRAAHPASGGGEYSFEFTLEKKIPPGAGLGGGSSNAVAALRALNELAGSPLDAASLALVAAKIGSDCPLFLGGGPVSIRGRGEIVEPLPASAADRLRGRQVLIFKPAFGISTPWAYARLDSKSAMASAAEAETRLAAWLGDASAPAEKLLFNAFEAPVFAKFPALPALLARLEADFGLRARMSGSGSACYALLPPRGAPPASAVFTAIRDAWGPSALAVETILI